MSDLATLIAQLSGSNSPPASDPALGAAVKLARASIDALLLKLGQTIDAKVTGQLGAGLTQLTAGKETFVLKLETPLPNGAAVTIKVTPTPQGTPAVTVSMPNAVPQPVLPLPTPSALPLVSTQVPRQEIAIPVARQLQSAQLPQPQPAITLAAGTPALAQTAGPLKTSTSQPAAAAAPAAMPAPQPAGPPVVGAAAVPSAQPPTPVPQSPASGQPIAPSPLPVTPAQAVPVQPAAPPPIPASPVPVALVPVTATIPQPTAAPARSIESPVVPAQPGPAPTTPLAATAQQPLRAHPSPYPVKASPVPQAATAVAAQQLSLAASPAASLAASPAVTTTPRPAAALLNLIDPAQAAARQDSTAPLLARLAAIVTAAAPSLPHPVLEAAQKVLANRVDLNRGPPDAKALEAAVLKAGVLLMSLTRQAPGDSRSAMLALRSTLTSFLGGDTAAPVTPVARPPPPMRGETPRAPAPQPALANQSAEGHETARTLLGHTDAALSRLKLLQSVSQPAGDTRLDASAPRGELRVEIPMLLGAETGILQLLVERDGKQKRQQRERGWRLRFAMNFSATGEVGADISMLGRSANIAIWAADPDTADALDELLPDLGPAIQRHGLELASLRVRRGAPRPARTAPGQLLDSAR